MEQMNYRVGFEKFARRHFVKGFEKKYRGRWPATERNIIAMCERIDNMLQYDRADLVAVSGCYKLVKLDFAVDGTRISPKASGNRCILLVDDEVRAVRILLVYSKNDIGPPNETRRWKGVVRGEYGDVADLFGI